MIWNMKSIIETAMLLIAVVSIVGGVWNRLKLGKGIGLRFVQYLGLTVLLPTFAILTLENRISQEMTGAIAVAAIGAVLAGLGKDGREE